MIKTRLTAAGMTIGLIAVSAHAQPVPAALTADPVACSTLGLAFQDSAAISHQNVETLRSRGMSSSILDSMTANAQKSIDTGLALEHRYGKAATPAQIADAAAMAQKPLKPMRDMAAVCLK